MHENPDEISFYHAPNTRSTGVRVLLEELAAPHRLCLVNMKADEQREAAYRAVNPMGKVPAIRHRGGLVTEQPAIYLYLADLFPERGLAPAPTDALRGPYLRWMVFHGSCFEPAVIDRALNRDAAPRAMSPYGEYDTVIREVTEALRPGPYLFGERFTAADVLWGSALGWTISFKIVAPDPVLTDYVARVRARPAARTVAQAEALLAAEHEAAARARG